MKTSPETTKNPSRKKVAKALSKIGCEQVYPLQIKVSDRVMANIRYNRLPDSTNKRSSIVVLQPQCGKTGVITCIIYAFIKDCKKRGKTFQVIVLCGLAALDLTDQTRKRLTQGVRSDGRTLFGAQLDMAARATGLAIYPDEFSDKGILIFHNSVKLKDLDLNGCEIDERLIITDEIHIGNGKEGCLDHFLQMHGVNINEQIHTWDNVTTMNHVVGVSATPFAHLVYSDLLHLQGEILFQPVYEVPTNDYNGIETMLGNKRLRQTESLFQKDGRPSTFFEKILDNFNTDCKQQGAGYLVLRAVGKKAKALYNYINHNGKKIECKEFSCDEKNLDELNVFLSRKPNEPTLVLIRGAYRAGITLGEKHYIRAWVETESDRCDTQTQAGVGRACGYGRTKDTYPIYCDLNSVEEVSNLYKDIALGTVKSMPKGTQNKGAKPHKVYPIKEVLNHEVAIAKYVTPFRKVDGKKKNRGQISSTAGTFANNTAKMVLEGRRDSGSTQGVFVNGPCTRQTMLRYIASQLRRGITVSLSDGERMLKEYQKSYRDLITVHPEYVGRVAIFGDSELSMQGETRDNLQKKTSALRGC